MSCHARVIWSMLVVATACRSEPSSPPPPPLPPQASFVATVHSTLARMHQHYGAARRIEEALVWGDLETAQLEAGRLGAVDEPDVLPRWQPFVERVRVAARAIESAGDIATAARRSAVLGGACSDCHADVGGRPTFELVGMPPAGETLGAQMRTHAWGAARMWEGLIGPENPRWEEGAGVLVLAPITITETDQQRLSGDMVALRRAMSEHVVRIRDYASKAMTPLTQPERVALYGEMLVTCASCHTLVRDVRPPPT